MSAHLTATLRRTVTRSEDVTSATVKAMLASLANVWQMCRGKCVCVCVCVRVSVCLSVSVSVSVCLYACGVAQQRTIAGIARATAVCILCSLSLFQTRAHMHICSHTRSAPSNGMQMSKRKHN